jgi:probable rRNA maturation factor
MKGEIAIDIEFLESEIRKKELAILLASLAEIKKALVIWIEKILPNYSGEASVVFCGDATSRDLNQRYRNQDKPTDVLSFPQMEWDNGSEKKIEYLQEPLGDIVVNVPKARKQCLQFGNSFLEEIYRLLCHGLLHLAGFDHELNSVEAKKMKKMENKLLSIILK